MNNATKTANNTFKKHNNKQQQRGEQEGKTHNNKEQQNDTTQAHVLGAHVQGSKQNTTSKGTTIITRQ